MSLRISSVIGVSLLLGGFSAVLGDEPVGDGKTAEPANAAPPRVNLRYVGLKNRTPVAISSLEKGELAKSAGALQFDFPANSFPSDGLDQEFLTFCCEPYVPIASGVSYPFAVEPFGSPTHFGLPGNEAGTAQADRRRKYVRELYGRYYQDTLADPDLANPAFQIALWELIAEPDFPEGPVPFHLFGGSFRSPVPWAESPDAVRRAQRYLESLTGDDSSFDRNPALKDLELVRLTGIAAGDVAAPQSQIALRRHLRPPAQGSDASVGGGSGSGLGRLAGGAGSPLGGGGGGGGGGLLGGGGGNTVANDPLVPPGTNPIDTGGGGGGAGPLDPDPNPPIVDPPVDPPPVTPPPVTPPPNPVPAPPGVVLGLTAFAFLGTRRLRSLAGRAVGK